MFNKFLLISIKNKKFIFCKIIFNIYAMLKNFQSFNERYRELLDIQFIKDAFADLIDEGAETSGGSTYFTILINMPSDKNLQSIDDYKEYSKKLSDTIDEVEIAIKRIEDELGISGILKKFIKFSTDLSYAWGLKIVYTLYPEDESGEDIPF